MDCNIIDECRCFAYDDTIDPTSYQFCGVRRSSNVLPCPAECCAGGCPGQDPKVKPREPFRIIGRPINDTTDHFSLRIFIFILLLIISYLILT